MFSPHGSDPGIQSSWQGNPDTGPGGDQRALTGVRLAVVTPDAAQRRSGAYSFAEILQFSVVPQHQMKNFQQADRRVGPGSALALGRDDGNGD